MSLIFSFSTYSEEASLLSKKLQRSYGCDGMRAGSLVVGAFLLIIGFIVFLSGYLSVQQYQTSLGQLATYLSSNAQAQYNQGIAEAIAGGILGFIGFAVCIYGAAASPQKTYYQKQATPRNLAPPPLNIQTTLTPPILAHQKAAEQRVLRIIEVQRQIIGLRQSQFHKFSVPAGLSGAVLKGSVQVSGGSRNDIEVLVMAESDFPKWKNGQQVFAYYKSELAISGEINVSLPPGGSYYLVFNNYFSGFVSKEISAQIDLFYMLE